MPHPAARLTPALAWFDAEHHRVHADPGWPAWFATEGSPLHPLVREAMTDGRATAAVRADAGDAPLLGRLVATRVDGAGHHTEGVAVLWLPDAESHHDSPPRPIHVVLDADDRIIVGSEPLEGLLGVQPGTVAGAHFLDRLARGESLVLSAAFARVRSGQASLLRLEHRLASRDVRRAVRTTISPSATGTPHGLELAIEDLGPARRGRLALEALEASFETLTAPSLDIWCVLEPSGVVRFASASLESYLGWTPPQVVGKPLLALLTPTDRPKMEAMLATLSTGEALVRTDVLAVRHAVGGERRLEMTISRLVPSRAGAHTLVLNARDVTARERLEQTLREVESRFRLLVEHAPTGVAVLRAGRVAYANPGFAQLVGMDEAALVSGVRALRFIHRDSVRAARAVRDAVEAGTPTVERVPLRLRRADGRRQDVEVHASPIAWDGNPAVLCNVLDVTDRNALQDRLAEAQRIEALGLLAGGVAHDFNNQLTAILAYADLARSSLADEEIVADIDEIRIAAERAAALTRQLLAFGRRQLLAPRPLDLSEVVRKLQRWLERVLGSDYPLLIDVPDTTWYVEADQGQVERVITSLVTNARDAMRGGGVVRMTVEHALLSAEQARSLPSARPGPHVVLAVRDEGVGMDAPTRQRIFEPFFTTKELGRGSGLGLAAVHGIVTQSGGAITVESEPGRGSTFRVFLPRVVTPVSSPTVLRSPASDLLPSTPLRVLLVEDDPTVCRVVRQMLGRRRHEVLVAEDASEALALVRAMPRPVDVAITDIGLRGMSGADLASELRRLQLARAIVLTTGRAEEDTAVRARALDAVFLAKPFVPASLFSAMAEALRLATIRPPR